MEPIHVCEKGIATCTFQMGEVSKIWIDNNVYTNAMHMYQHNTQVKTRVGWVSTFEHTSLVLVLGCRLIFGQPYIPEIGIGKKLIFSGVLPLLGYYWYKAGITSVHTSLPQSVHRPEYVPYAGLYTKSTLINIVWAEFLLSFEHCPQGLFRLGRPLQTSAFYRFVLISTGFQKGLPIWSIMVVRSLHLGRLCYLMLSLAFIRTLSSCSSLVAHLPFGMMSLAALTCHLGDDSGRLSDDNKHSKTHHGLRNLNTTNKTNKQLSLIRR